ncbi:hypothetical protein NC651_035573 [Populus alba x Populus x berolinensis]|nr:hypothetical protein NC651_035573 [Populus alba x Populus x berolinensis]
MLLELALSDLLLAKVVVMLRSWCLLVKECKAGKITFVGGCYWWPRVREKMIDIKWG